MSFEMPQVSFNGRVMSLVPFTEATSSGANTPLEANLSEEEVILGSLSRERNYTPLFLLHSQATACLSDNRLKAICGEVRILWDQTMGQKLLLPDHLIPGHLHALQLQVLETNLLKIGKVWDKGCTCFGCCIDVPEVEKWVQKDPEKLRAQLQKEKFRNKWISQCTFIPSDVVPLIGDAHWVSIGEHALFPNPKSKHWHPKASLFLQVMALKKDQISPETLENWLIRVVDAYKQWESERRRFEYEAVIEPIVQLALQVLTKPLDEVLKSFMQGRPYRRSCILRLAVKITDPLLEEYVKTCTALFMSHKKSSIEKSKIYLEAIKWAGSQRIAAESFKEFCDDFSVMPKSYYSIFIPHLSTVSTKVLKAILFTGIAKDQADLLTAVLQQHEKISDPIYQSAFLEVKKNAQFLSLFLTHNEKLDRAALGESLCRCTTAHSFDCVTELLAHAEQIPPSAFVKSLMCAAVTHVHVPIRTVLSPKVKGLKSDLILPILQTYTADERLKFLNHLESIAYPFLSAFDEVKIEWKAEWEKEHEEQIRIESARSEQTPTPSFGNSTISY